MSLFSGSLAMHIDLSLTSGAVLLLGQQKAVLCTDMPFRTADPKQGWSDSLGPSGVGKNTGPPYRQTMAG